MKNQYYNYIFLFSIILFSLLVGSLLNGYSFDGSYNEGFTPYIRSLYRPHLRNARLMYEGVKTSTNSKLNTIFRKVGLY
jgi:hypothetical protein